MKPDYNLCDCCGKPTKSTIYAVVSSENPKPTNVDWCGECALGIVQSFFGRVPNGPNYEPNPIVGDRILYFIAESKRRGEESDDHEE